MWLPKYRHEIEYRDSENDYVVKVFDGIKLIQVSFFNTCSAALSFVERREESYRKS
jgi:hypothetical protein